MAEPRGPLALVIILALRLWAYFRQRPGKHERKRRPDQ